MYVHIHIVSLSLCIYILHIRTQFVRAAAIIYVRICSYVRMYASPSEPSLGSCWVPEKIRKRRGSQLGFGNLILYGRAYLNDTRLI